MAKQFYQKSGDDLVVWDDPQNLTTQDDIQARIDALEPFQSLEDGSRTLLAQGGVPAAGIHGGWQTLADFDAYLLDEIERLKDVRDYYDYSTKQETIGNVADGSWWIPEAVESFSSETPVAGLASLAIDATNSTGWTPLSAPAEITFRLRSYRKNVESIRLWIPNNTLKTELQGLTVKAAQSLSQIDEPTNAMLSGLNLSFNGAAWQELVFPQKKRCRYIKLEMTGSNHLINVIQVRSIEARVVTFNHEK